MLVKIKIGRKLFARTLSSLCFLRGSRVQSPVPPPAYHRAAVPQSAVASIPPTGTPHRARVAAIPADLTARGCTPGSPLRRRLLLRSGDSPRYASPHSDFPSAAPRYALPASRATSGVVTPDALRASPHHPNHPRIVFSLPVSVAAETMGGLMSRL
jgi:hypothetical protein